MVLNLSEDHMDRYAGMADYRAAKMEIHQHSQHILINRDDPQTLPDVGQVWRVSASTATATVAASWRAVTG